MASRTVHRQDVVGLVREWIEQNCTHSPNIEIVYRPGELVLHAIQDTHNQEELKQWLDDYLRKNDSLMRRLADA